MCKLECLLHLFDNTLLQEVVVQRFAMLMVEILKMIFLSQITGQTQQVVTQIIRGQPVSTAVSSTSTASSSSGQKTVTSPATPPQQIQPQTTSQPPRPQQGQVKLTMDQLTQLTQGQVKYFRSSGHENVLMLAMYFHRSLDFSSECI